MEYRGRCTAPRMETARVIGRGTCKNFSVIFFILTCTGGGFAQPDNSCNITLVGNGACDSDNNNEDCSYDGGDCCNCTSGYGVSYDDDYFFSSSTVCRDPDSECVHPAILYPNCTNGTLSWIGDGYCDDENNNESCDYDGGDCCECSCTDGDLYLCGVNGYFCVDPACAVDPRIAEYPDCDMDIIMNTNDSYCDESTNTPDCGYDGGDCCPCTCSYVASDSCSEFFCLDPGAPDPLYNCEDPPVAVQPCEAGDQSKRVENTVDAQALVEALNCSGGVFQVTWVDHVVVNEPMYVVNGTVLNVTGAGSMATIAGATMTRLFTVVNASLHVANVIMTEGHATSGGAIGASASSLTFSRVNFITNNVSTFGGALFLSGGSNITFDGPCEIVKNSASFGGALFLEGGSRASWTISSLFSRNSATVEGGAVAFTGGSSGLWFGQSDFTSNAAGYRGGALHMVNGSDISLSGQTNFWENEAWKGGGGALYVTEGSGISWTGKTRFMYNKAFSNGGALFASNGSVISWEGPTTFSSNSVQSDFVFAESGAFGRPSDDGDDFPLITYSYGYSNPYPESSLLSASSSSVDTELSEGGALYVGDHSNVFWNADTIFSENTADIGGAVLITDGSTVEWIGSTTFFSNAAASEGGAVASKALEEIISSSSSSSTSSSWIVNDEESELKIRGNTTFNGNKCGASGGALVLLGMLSLTIDDGANVTFSGNSADASGGAVFISSTEVGPEFVDTVFVDNSAPVGGAVVVSGSGTKITSDGKGGRSYKDPTTFRNCKFINNDAVATGGAVDSASGRDLFVETTFKGNTASGGGALRLTSVATISECLFEENKSDVEGGPAVAYFGTALDIHNSNFTDNMFSCSSGTYLDFNKSDNIFATVCKNCDGDCSSCKYGGRTVVPLECVSLSKDGLDEHAKSYGGSLSELMIDKGYWRATSDSTRVLECYHKEACQGGMTGTDDFCAEGYRGSYCTVCKEDWYSTGVAFKCKKCAEDQRMWGIVIAAVFGLLTVFFLVLIYSHLMSGEVVGTGQGIVDRVIRYVPLQSVKILIVAWQIESQFYAAANVEYPPIYSKFLERVTWVDFNWSRMISTSCLLDIGFYRRLLLLTIAPIVILALLMVTYAIATRKHRASERALRTVKSKHVSMVLLVTFLVYSSASTVVFQMFDCEDLEDNKTYNRADYSVECDTDLHNRLEWYAGFMIAVYPIGIPLFYAFLLFRDRHILVDKEHREIEPNVESTSDLWAPYKPSRFYYEVVECMRRVFLTGVVLLLEGDTAAQIAVTFVVAVSFVFVFEGLDPYESRWDTWISRMGHIVVCASMFFALLLKVDVSGEDKKSRRAFEITIIIAHACMILAVMLEGLIMVCALRLANKRREDPLPRIRSAKRLAVSIDNLPVPEDELRRDSGNMWIDRDQDQVEDGQGFDRWGCSTRTAPDTSKPLRGSLHG